MEREGEGVRDMDKLRRLDGGEGWRVEMRDGVAPRRVFSESALSVASMTLVALLMEGLETAMAGPANGDERRAPRET